MELSHHTSGPATSNPDKVKRKYLDKLGHTLTRFTCPARKATNCGNPYLGL